MATLQDYLGITKLRDAWPKWKANVVAVNNQVIAHIAGTADKHLTSHVINDSEEAGTTTADAINTNKAKVADHVAGTADKHSAQDITYTGDFTGKTEVKAALDQAKTEIDTIVISASIDPEVALARESLVKAKTFATIDARFEESEQDLVSYQTETTALINSINPWQIYGYKIDEANSNPETAVTYMLESVGKTPATAGDGASESWDATPIYNELKYCMFKNGVVNYYLDPLDITKKEDGVTPADITTGADGDVMVEFPQLWWKMNKANAEIYAYLSKTKGDINFEAPAHTVGNTIKNKIYISVYPGIIIGGKLRSLSGHIPTASETIGTFRIAAQANGLGYQQFGYYQWLMLQHLFYLRFKDRDSQVALGRGYTELDVIKATGDTNAQAGLYYGTTSDQVSMKCFGIEALWGYQVTWTDGLFSDAERNILIGDQTVYNDNGAGYANYGQGATENISGYTGTVQGGTETGFIIKTADGSSTTRFADYGFLVASRVANSGGDRANGAHAGIGRLYALHSGAEVDATIGGRLVFVGEDNDIS